MTLHKQRNLFLLAVLVLVCVLAIDQSLKIWVLKHMYLGQTKTMIGNWFFLHFTENNGMAFGVELGGIAGKLTLTGFRLVAVGGILWYLRKQIRSGASAGLVFCISLILAGAIGNIIDSVFYGVWFPDLVTYDNKGRYFLGRVVDMLYFPIVETHYPSWFPLWGGQDLTFFRPIFNIADASISTGVIAIIVFQKKFFAHTHPSESENAEMTEETDLNTETTHFPESDESIKHAGTTEQPESGETEPPANEVG